MKRPLFKYKVHQKLLVLPGLGKVIRGVNTARFARTLSILTASAVPLLESMSIAGEVLENLFIKIKLSNRQIKYAKALACVYR